MQPWVIEAPACSWGSEFVLASALSHLSDEGLFTAPLQKFG
jgi:hypothetical protein